MAKIDHQNIVVFHLLFCLCLVQVIFLGKDASLHCFLLFKDILLHYHILGYCFSTSLFPGQWVQQKCTQYTAVRRCILYENLALGIIMTLKLKLHFQGVCFFAQFVPQKQQQKFYTLDCTQCWCK